MEYRKAWVSEYIELLENGNDVWRAYSASALGGPTSELRAVPPLIRALNDECSRVRSKAARSLGTLEDKRAVRALGRVLKNDPCTDVRINAAEALGNIRDPSAIPALIRALKDEDKDVRFEAVKALGWIKHPRAIPSLIRMLKTDHIDEAARALAMIEDGRAAPALVRALDTNLSKRKDVYYALLQIGVAALPALTKGLRSRLKKVRLMSACAIGIIGSHNRENKKFLEVLPSLIGSLNSKDSTMRDYVAKALENIGKPVIPLLIDALDNGLIYADVSAVLVKIGRDALPELIEAVKEKPKVRQNAVYTLGKIGNTSAVPSLVETMNDPILLIRIGVVDALKEILDKCYRNVDINEFKSKLQEGYDLLRKRYKRHDLSKAQFQITNLMIIATDKGNELSKDKGVLLDDKPKPPKGNRIYQQVRRIKNA
jgi:HEAT repeat protein